MIKTKSEIFEKAMEIERLYREMQEALNKNILSMRMDNAGLSFQIYDKEDFVNVAKENMWMFEVEEFTEDYPYRIKTAINGVEFFILAQLSEHDYIVNQLF